MFRFFRKVMDSVCWLLKAHGHLATQVLQSDHYERMLMSEEERVGTVCVSLWHQLLTANSELVAGLGKGPLSVILDDVMAHTSNPAVGGAAIRTLLLVARQQESALQLIIHRFKGLEGMIGREWRGRGFDEEVDQLIKLLHREVPKPADHTEVKYSVFVVVRVCACLTLSLCYQTWPEECVRAVCVIQAAWRSYQTRRRVKSLPRAVRSLQRSFRERRQRRVQQAQAECWEEELRLQLCVRRQRARREFHQKQLQLLQLLSPGTHTLPVTAETESQERVPSETTTVTTVTVPRSGAAVPRGGGEAGCHTDPEGLARPPRETTLPATEKHTHTAQSCCCPAESSIHTHTHTHTAQSCCCPAESSIHTHTQHRAAVVLQRAVYTHTHTAQSCCCPAESSINTHTQHRAAVVLQRAVLNTHTHTQHRAAVVLQRAVLTHTHSTELLLSCREQY
eukprot:XP_014007916.1 PREDICTED: IQ calmodulin-binding motif-containing protein 1-like isoform X5 [Salmo salar]